MNYIRNSLGINAYKYFFSNRICDIWNALPNFVFDVSSSNSFRRLLDKVDLSQFTVLLWLFIVIILLGICKWLHALYVQWVCSCSMFILKTEIVNVMKQNFNKTKQLMTKISTVVTWHCYHSFVLTSNLVDWKRTWFSTTTRPISYAKNGNNVEATFDIVERIV